MIPRVERESTHLRFISLRHVTSLSSGVLMAAPMTPSTRAAIASNTT